MSLTETRLELCDEDRALLRRLVASFEMLAKPLVFVKRGDGVPLVRDPDPDQLVSERARQVYRDLAKTEKFSGACPTCGQEWRE